ncbi:hypothetical protein GGF32_008185 [Allomyces javanicus]|nr:hypothetical protein GGF32_008185 [Allomyces javanicus]
MPKNVQVTVAWEKGTAPATIDVSQPMFLVIQQIVAAIPAFPLGGSGSGASPGDYCLRTLETDELISPENLLRNVKTGETIKIVPAPALEAPEFRRRLASLDSMVQKRTLFAMQNRVKEEEFALAFVSAGGVEALKKLVLTSDGNSLAYALSALSNFMEEHTTLASQQSGLISSELISRLMHLVVTETLVNICRPATALLIRILQLTFTAAEADAARRTAMSATASADALAALTDNEVAASMELVHQVMVTSGKPLLAALIQRLSASEYVLQLHSLALINAVFKFALAGGAAPATTGSWANLTAVRPPLLVDMEKLNLRPVVARMMQLSSNEEKNKELVEFQTLTMQHLYRQKSLRLDSLDAVFDDECGIPDPQNVLQLLGCDTEVPADMARVGVLGADALCQFIAKYRSDFNEWAALPVETRPSLTKISSEITEYLSDFWELSTGFSTSTTLQPHILLFDQIHHLFIRLFRRLWEDTLDLNASLGMIRTELRHVLRNHALATMDALEKIVMGTPVSVIRDRHLKELEDEDEIMAHPIVRKLRDVVNKESFEFVKQQRLACLCAGAWFHLPPNASSAPPVNLGSSTNQGSRKLAKSVVRFCRLSGTKKTLYYADFPEVLDKKPSLEQLTQRVDLANVADIVTGSTASAIHSSVPTMGGGGSLGMTSSSTSMSLATAAAVAAAAAAAANNFSGRRGVSPTPSTSSTTATGATDPRSMHCFSLMQAGANDADLVSIMDLVCMTPTQYSEWTDGFNLLLNKGITNKDTAEFVQALTEIQLRIRLLDITADRIPLCQPAEMPPLPPDVSFFYEDVAGIGGP